MKEYTKEFYKLNIRARQRERDEEKVFRYINGLRCDIQDEISMATVRTVEDTYQMALKEEEKLARKQIQHNRGRSLNGGKGVAQDKTQKPKDEARSHIVTLREEEVPEEGRVVVEVIFPQEEEEAKEDK
jgi:hypothetical protein